MATPDRPQEDGQGREVAEATETPETRRGRFIAVGICLGVALGAPLGLLVSLLFFDNLVFGLPLGIALGMAVGAAVGSQRAAAVEGQGSPGSGGR